MASPVLILLASNSPRRRLLLSWTGWMFHVQPADIDETPHAGETPGEYVLRLAESKARAVAGESRPGTIVFAADTTVADGDTILGKPGSPVEARDMLRRLRGCSHQVFTALAVMDSASSRLEKDLCVTNVPMRKYTDLEMEAYIASGDPYDKAGGYAIQDPDFHPVEHMEGCYACVIGLPLCHLVRTLRRFGIEPRSDVPGVCQMNLQYTCPVYQKILGRDERFQI